MIIGRRSFLLSALALIFVFAAGFLSVSLARNSTSALAGAPVAPLAPNGGTEPLPPGATIETLLSNMTRPIAMAFDPAGRLFYTEKETGRVRLFENGVLQASPVITYSVDGCNERGLLGIAVDPNFNANHYIYVFYTAWPGSACGATTNRVARFVESGGSGSGSLDIFTSTQTAPNHNGGNIHFGPDGKLYVSLGENAVPSNSQDVTVKPGKIHRINSDGTIPPDNPVFTQTGALPSLYAMGLRNTFDFTFDPIVTGRIFASENGPNCDDEMNRIEAGYNYGWRSGYPCGDTSIQYNTIPSLWSLPSGQCCEAPTGIVVYTGTQVPQWTNHLFMETFNNGTGILRHMYLNAARTALTQTNVVTGVIVGTDIENGPDGALWYIQGGGYVPGTLKRIIGPTSTATATPVNTATRTRTRTNTPVVTPTPFDQDRLIGHVIWQGRPSQPNALQSLPITLTLHWISGNTNFDFSSTTDASGFFTVATGLLPNGSYTWRAKGPRYLASSGNVTITDANVHQEMGLQLAGDANGDNCVNITDFNILKDAFGTSIGDPDYDARADFTGDNTVTILDYNLLRANFGICGAPPVLVGER